jgi:hypothetical protein
MSFTFVKLLQSLERSELFLSSYQTATFVKSPSLLEFHHGE